ncbi:MAG: oligosaccharide flippase family protein [Bacteroidales bacterium]|nr:oligosaccharide flippase family protein [Bacteroidales bacterium]
MEKIKELLRKYVINNEIFSRFVRIFSVDVLVRGANFFLIFVFLYLMTKEEFGIYGYLYSFAMTLSGILGFGFYISITKLYADTINDRKRQGSAIFTTTTSMLFLLAISLIVIYFTKIDVAFFSMLNNTSQINANSYLNYRLYVFIALVSMVFTTYLTFFFVGAEQIRKLQVFNLTRFFFANGSAILVLYFFDGNAAILRLAFTYIAELILTIIFGIFIFKSSFAKFDFFFLKKDFKIGLPIMVGTLISSVVGFGDKFFVMKFSGVDSFAVYNLGVMLSTIVLIVYQSFNFVWLPLFLKEKDLIVLRRKTNRYVALIFLSLSLLSIIICIGVVIGLKIELIPDKYSGVLSYLPLLLLGQVFAALVGLLVNFMTYFEKTYIQILVGAFVSLVGYFLYDFLVGNYFAIGASIALLLLNILSFLIYYFRIQYYINNRLK